MLLAKSGANWSNCQGGVGKSTFFLCGDFANGNLPRKLAWPTSHNSAEFREHVDITSLSHIMWELFGTTGWSFLVYELQGPVYNTPMNFIDKIVMVWAQCQIYNKTATRVPPRGRLVTILSAVLRRALGKNCTKFCLNPTDQC